MRTRWTSYLPVALIVAFLGCFLVWPMFHVFSKACVDKQGITGLYLVGLFRNPVQREAAWNSLQIAIYVTFGCILVSMPLAWLFARRSFFGKAVLGGLMLFPMILPPFVSAVGMKMVFARAGALSTLLMDLGVVRGPVDWLGAYPMLGVVILEVLHLFPILYLTLVAAFANIDPSLEEAAANLGATPGRVFWRVTLPLAAPGMFAAWCSSSSGPSRNSARRWYSACGGCCPS